MTDLSTPTGRLAWLVRALRLDHPDPDLADLEVFRRRFSRKTHIPSVETIRKLERGRLKFTIERCADFEHALDLDSGTLVDVYCYLSRIHGEIPVPGTKERTPGGASDWNLWGRFWTGDSITPVDWLRLSAAYRRVPDQLNQNLRLREILLDRYFEALDLAYERDERILLEAAIGFADLIAPELPSRVNANRLGLFNLTEVLGHIRTKQAVQALSELLPLIDDDFTSMTVLESVARILRCDPELLEDQPQLQDTARSYALHCLDSDRLSYMAKEESLALVSCLRPTLNSSEIRLLSNRREDFAQVLSRPTSCKPEDLLAQLERNFARTLKSQDTPRADGVLFSGLANVCLQGLTTHSRRGRLAVGVLLGPYPASQAVTHAVGEMLVNHLPGSDYGLQRSAVRLITKLQHPARLPYLLDAGQATTMDDGLRCVVGWALGPFSDDKSVATLARLASEARIPHTKRAILVAARRQGNIGVAEHFLDDSDSRVASDAAISHRKMTAGALLPRAGGE